jgi:hypothetical protein
MKLIHPDPPAPFRVGARRYDVRVSPGPIVFDGDRCLGFCDAASLTITVSGTLARDRRLEVLLHELAHAHMFAYGRPCGDEGLCDFVATVAAIAMEDVAACGGVAALESLNPGESLRVRPFAAAAAARKAVTI